MNQNVKRVVVDYYQELQSAFQTKRLNFSKLHLDDDVCVIAANESFKGRQKVEEMFQQFIAVVEKFDIKKQYFDQDSACTILDCVTNTAAGIVITAELILIKNDRIIEIHPIYDTAAWAKITQ